jgi:hypothetical protein
MPGWYIHLDVARTAALILGQPVLGEPLADRPAAAEAFVADGPTAAELASIIEKYPNYYALGACDAASRGYPGPAPGSATGLAHRAPAVVAPGSGRHSCGG